MKGAMFTMHQHAPGNWTRHSVKADGSLAFPDYYPTVVAKCASGVDHPGLQLALSSIKDYPTFDKNGVSGGASREQVLRIDSRY